MSNVPNEQSKDAITCDNSPEKETCSSEAKKCPLGKFSWPVAILMFLCVVLALALVACVVFMGMFKVG